MTIFVYIVIAFCCVVLIAAVLLQPSKGGGLSALGGSSQSVFGSTGGTTFLFRTTMIMATIVAVLSLWLTRSQIQKAQSSVIDISAPAIDPNLLKAPTTPAETTPPPAEAAPQNLPTAPAATPGK